MPNFSVYHLEHEQLMSIAQVDSETVEPRLRETHKNVKRSYLALSHRKRLRQAKDKSLVWAEIAEAAEQLMQRTFYHHVADLNAESMIAAIRKSTSFNERWELSKGVTVVGEPLRSTANLDVIGVKDKYYLIVTGGFLCLDSKQFAGHLNEM